MKPIVIHPKFTKQLWMVIAGCALLGTGVFVMQLDPNAVSSPWRRAMLQAVGRPIAILGMVLFGAFLGYALYRLWKPRAVLAIDGDGFTDGSSMFPAGFVPWGTVKELGIYEVSSQRFLGVTVWDEEDFLQSLSPLKQKLVRSNLKLGYPPILITLQATSVSMEDALFGMQQAFSGWEAAEKRSAKT